MPSSRRFFLASAAMLTGAFAVSAPFKTRAFELDGGNEEATTLYANRCSVKGNSYHEQLVADLMTKLQGHSQTEIETALASLTCPICGCHIA
jgi:hypothetical protein